MLARSEHQNFHIDGASTSVLKSMTAFTVIAQLIAFEVGRKRGEDARAHLRHEERLVQSLNVYDEDPLDQD